MTKNVRLMMDASERLKIFVLIGQQVADLTIQEKMRELHVAANTLENSGRGKVAQDCAQGALIASLRRQGIRVPDALLVCKYIYASGAGGQSFETMLTESPNMVEEPVRFR